MAHPVVDELVAVDVPLAAAIGALNIDREWGEVATIVGNAAGDCIARTCVKLRRSRESLAEGVVDRGRGRNCHTQSLPFGRPSFPWSQGRSSAANQVEGQIISPEGSPPGKTC